jgi:hypothetical protein
VRSATGNPMKGLEVAFVEFKNISAEISLSDDFTTLANLLLMRQIRIINEVRIEGKGSFYIPINTVVFLDLID